MGSDRKKEDAAVEAAKPEPVKRPRDEKGRLLPTRRDPEKARFIEALAQYGVPQQTIANIARLRLNTLQREYREELDRGMANGNAKLVQTLFDMAVNQRNVACLIFACKTRLGMKETGRIEMTSPDGSLTPKASEIPALIAAMKKLQETY